MILDNPELIRVLGGGSKHNTTWDILLDDHPSRE